MNKARTGTQIGEDAAAAIADWSAPAFVWPLEGLAPLALNQSWLVMAGAASGDWQGWAAVLARQPWSVAELELPATGAMPPGRWLLMPWPGAGECHCRIGRRLPDAEPPRAELQALREKAERLERITDSIPEPVAYVDDAFRYQYVNLAFCRLVGIDRARVLGKRPAEVLGVEGADIASPHIERAMTGESTMYQRLIPSPNTLPRWYQVKLEPDRLPDGHIRGVYVVGQDIHAIKAAQEEVAERERRLRSFIDGIPAPVSYISKDRRFVIVNSAFLAFFSRDDDPLVGQRIEAAVDRDTWALIQPKVEEALAGATVRYERLVATASGEYRWMLTQLVPDVAIDARGRRSVEGVFDVMTDIHDRKVAEQALGQREAELRMILDALPAPCAYVNSEQRYRFVNRSLERWVGKPASEILGHTILEVMGAAAAEAIQPYLARALRGEEVLYERRIEIEPGQPRWMQVRYLPDRQAGGQVLGYFAMMSDIHRLKESEERLRQAHWLLDSHIENSPLAVVELDGDGRIVRWSSQAEAMFGWTAADMVGRRMQEADFVYEEDWPLVAHDIDRLKRRETTKSVVLHRNCRKDGSIAWCEWYNSSLYDESGRLVSILSLAQDISGRIQAEERLQYLANHDPLTGLPNRTLLQERLLQAVSRSRRSGQRVCVLFIDLDRFKIVNDSLGHRIGDLLLKQVAASLASCLREADTLARLGGDEFMMVLEDQVDSANAAIVAHKVLEVASRSFRVEGHEIYIGASIGIAQYPDDGHDIDTLIRNADVAMYRAKELGKNTYQFFSLEMAQRRQQQHRVENALRHAVRNGELTLHYQPKVVIRTGEIVGAEALLRWNSPQLGMVSPADFIPLAEESGLIHEVGEWVLRAACRQLRAWQDQRLRPFTVAINLSARQFRQVNLAQNIELIVKETGCPPELLEFEVTETSVMFDPDRVQLAMEAIKRMGARIAIDDFGTGYSSLAYLKRFPIDTLKIDRSFIRDILQDPDDAAITRAIIVLAQSLNLVTVAEGVETREHLDFLAGCGCDAYQGFWFSRPLPAETFAEILRQRSQTAP